MKQVVLNKYTKKHIHDLFIKIYKTTPKSAYLKRFVEVMNNDLTSEEVEAIINKFHINGSEQLSMFEILDEEKKEIKKITAKLKDPVRYKYIVGITTKKEPITIDFNLDKSGLTIRSVNMLAKINIVTVKDLLNVQVIELLNIKNLGDKAFKEIIDFISINKNLK